MFFETTVDPTLTIWHVVPEEISTAALKAKLPTLTFEEKERANGFTFDQDRHNYFLRKIMARELLGMVLNTNPADLQFFKNTYGKPSVVKKQNWANIDFSISFTKGVIVIAISNCGRVGIDVESLNRPRDLSVANDFFAAIEVRDLLQTKEADQLNQFYKYWTLKEAYIKAQGKGLAIDLSSFAFVLEGDKIDFVDYTGIEKSDTWVFDSFKITSNYLVAIASKPVARPSSIKRILKAFTLGHMHKKEDPMIA